MSFSPTEKLHQEERELALMTMQLAQMVAAGDVSQNEADRRLAIKQDIVADYQALHIKARTHELKSWPDWFKPTMLDKKKFELRKHDRDFQEGDLLILREWDDRARRYTGAQIERRISYILTGIGQGSIEPLIGLHRDYCILSLEHPLPLHLEGGQPGMPTAANIPNIIETDELETAAKEAYSGMREQEA